MAASHVPLTFGEIAGLEAGGAGGPIFVFGMVVARDAEHLRLV